MAIEIPTSRLWLRKLGDATYPTQEEFCTVAPAQAQDKELDSFEQGGLLVSEYPIGTPSARIRFHARCRLLAALAAATVIVEAGQRSGALAVARAAGKLGRRVYGVPGSIHSVTSKGVNELLRTGAATVASSVEHINYQEGVR